MSAENPVETEIKVAIADPEAVVSRIREAGFHVHRHRVFEVNQVYDTAAGSLRANEQLLRLRDAGGVCTLTWKGPAQRNGIHKSRPEIETTLGDGRAFDVILRNLGYSVKFRYDKYRTEFSKSEEQGVITLDETPIGWFLELEGEPGWIDATASILGFDKSRYITASYGTLYLEHCRNTGQEPAWMVFPASKESIP